MRSTHSRPKVSRGVFCARCLRKALWSNGGWLRDPLWTHLTETAKSVRVQWGADLDKGFGRLVR